MPRLQWHIAVLPAVYVLDEEMQQIGTAAVHLVTIANSYMAAQSPDTAAAR
jgi:hypothetical protein